MAPLTNNEKKTLLLPMVVINRFEISCGTFKRRKGRNPLSSMTLGKFARGKYIYIQKSPWGGC
jgi:hypothetical protein